jgi:peptide/nickel transport system substrate-binding protein
MLRVEGDGLMMTLRNLAVGTALGALLAGAAGPALAASHAMGKPGGTLVMGTTQVPRHFNPAVQSGIATMGPGAQIFATLVRADAEWNFHPYLAESWQVSDDGLTVTFKLRQGAKFHDGQEITSADVAFSVATQQANHPFKTSLGAVTAVETPDATTAVFRLSQPHPALLLALSTSITPIIPKHIYGDGQDPKSHPRNTTDVVGSGAFRLKEYKQGEFYTLEKNPSYFLEGRPFLDRIVTKIIRDASSLVLAAENGEIDMLAYLTTSGDVERLQNDPDLLVTDEGYAGIGPINWLAFNTKKGPLADVKVRQAIAHAVDRRFITKALHRGFSKPATGPIVPGSPYYSADVPTYDFDLKKAAALLDEAGYKAKDDGTRFTLEVDFIPGGVEQQKAVAEYLRPALKKVGIDVQVRNSPDFPTWAKRVSSWEFDMTMDLVFNWGDPVIGVHRTYLCDNAKQGVIWSNTQQYCNPAVDELLAKAGQELDPAKRKAQYAEFQKLVATDVPIYWVNVAPYYTAYDKRLGNPPTSIWGIIAPLDEVYWKEPK